MKALLLLLLVSAPVSGGSCPELTDFFGALDSAQDWGSLQKLYRGIAGDSCLDGVYSEGLAGRALELLRSDWYGFWESEFFQTSPAFYAFVEQTVMYAAREATTGTTKPPAEFGKCPEQYATECSSFAEPRQKNEGGN